MGEGPGLTCRDGQQVETDSEDCCHDGEDTASGEWPGRGDGAVDVLGLQGLGPARDGGVQDTRDEQEQEAHDREEPVATQKKERNSQKSTSDRADKSVLIMGVVNTMRRRGIALRLS